MSEPRRAWLPVAGWSVGALFFFYAWVLRVAPSVMVEELMRDLSIGGAVLGQLAAWYFYGYAGMQIPAGVLLDRFGPRRLMTVAALTCAGGCVLFTAGSLPAAALGRFLIGAGAAFSLVGAMAVAARWFSPRRFALLGGLAMMSGMMGGVFGQAPLRTAVESAGWRGTMLTAAACGLAIAVAAAVLVRDRQRGSGNLGEVMRGLRRVAGNRQSWLAAICGLGAGGPLLGFAALWGVPYLETAYRLERTEAAALTSLLLVGFGAASPLIGWWSDRIGRRKLPTIVGSAVSLVTMAIVAWVPGLPLWALGALCFLMGVAGSIQICVFALVREHNDPRLSGTAIGLANALITGAGALLQPAVGALLDLRWDGTMRAGARLYESADYRFALGAIVASSALGLACALALRESPVAARG